MKRFYFHIRGGIDLQDDTGLELPDIHAARQAVLKLAADVLSLHADDLWQGRPWAFDVADAAGTVLFTIRFSADTVTRTGPQQARLGNPVSTRTR